MANNVQFFGSLAMDLFSIDPSQSRGIFVILRIIIHQPILIIPYMSLTCEISSNIFVHVWAIEAVLEWINNRILGIFYRCRVVLFSSLKSWSLEMWPKEQDIGKESRKNPTHWSYRCLKLYWATSLVLLQCSLPKLSQFTLFSKGVYNIINAYRRKHSSNTIVNNV